jgi:hypothetical protein
MKELIIGYGIKLLLWVLQHPDEVKKRVDEIHAAKTDLTKS